jgi:hypothetical protein
MKTTRKRKVVADPAFPSSHDDSSLKTEKEKTKGRGKPKLLIDKDVATIQLEE